MTICGLDFGTSNSTVGVIKNDNNVMVPLERDSAGHWQTTLPSALFFDFESNQIDFGRHAIRQYTAGRPGRLMRSMKNLLGSSYMSDKTQVKNRFYSYDEIVGFFVETLKKQAEEFLGNESQELAHPWVQCIASSIAHTIGEAPAIIPSMGGSICNDLFTDLLDLPAIWIPRSYAACSQHAPNEHILLSVTRSALPLMTGLYWDIGDGMVPK